MYRLCDLLSQPILIRRKKENIDYGYCVEKNKAFPPSYSHQKNNKPKESNFLGKKSD